MNKSRGKVIDHYDLEGYLFIYEEYGKRDSKIFLKFYERYYKEEDRGIGIGMHIVKKLCDELNIVIKNNKMLKDRI